MSDSRKNQKSAEFIIHIVVIASYAIKSSIKTVFGIFLLGSIPLIIEAVHGLIDIIEHIIISIAGYFARKEPDEKFPIGRKPLLDVIGMVIGISVILLAVTCFKNAMFGNSDNSSYGREGIAKLSLVFLFCSVISWIVYFFEKRLAIKNSLREYVDDADELSHDAVLELGAGLAGVAAWSMSFIWPEMIGSIHSLLLRVMLFGIGSYLLYHGIKSFWENKKNLLNPGLDRSFLSELREHINLNLPDGCKIDRKDLPLTTFSRADQLFVFGTICIQDKLKTESQRILENAENTIRKYLSCTGKNIIVKLDLEILSDNENKFGMETEILLDQIWGLNNKSILFEGFHIFRKGDILGSYNAVNSIDLLQLRDEEKPLYKWICCCKILYIDGPNSLASSEADNSLKMEHNVKICNSSEVMFVIWRFLRIILSGDLYKSKYDIEIEDITGIIEDIVKDSKEFPAIIKAECAFVLGIYYERSNQYDIDKSTSYYKIAERLYFESGIVSEADRLYNSWGHQRMLLYELEEAAVLLEKSLKIKKDKTVDTEIIGISYTLGSLADVYCRSGMFKKADEYYARDLELIRKAQLDHFESGVFVKRAESLIKKGLWERDSESIIFGLDICRRIVQTEQAEKTNFFAMKAIVKALLWFCELVDDTEKRSDMISECNKLLEKMEPFSNYSKAFKMRLEGRYLGEIGSFRQAYKCFIKSEALFISMSRGLQFRNSAIQSIVCKLEIAKYKIRENCQQLNQLQIAIDDLHYFISPLKGLLGNVQTTLEHELESLEKALKFLHKNKKIKPNFISENIFRPLNRLIVLLEG